MFILGIYVGNQSEYQNKLPLIRPLELIVKLLHNPHDTLSYSALKSANSLEINPVFLQQYLEAGCVHLGLLIAN